MIRFDKEKCNMCKKCIEKCKFNAITIKDNFIEINNNCINCNSCVKACKTGALSLINLTQKQSNIDEYKDILVFIQVEENNVLNVSLELINKAFDLAKKLKENVNVVLLGNTNIINSLTSLGINKIYNFTDKSFNVFNAEIYIKALYMLINEVKPSIVLFGATNEGRQIATHIANLCQTGLTADCTNLDIIDGNLLQVRPAYGGKIMAEIVTENTRPQIATVKNGIFEKATKINNSNTQVITYNNIFNSINTSILDRTKKPNINSIEQANILLCLGNAVKEKSDMELFNLVAKKLNATICGTRALVEKGFLSPDKQVGLSGHGVSPKLLITFGVSGSIQFQAGIKSCKNIIAVNLDKNANMLKIANYSIVADRYEIANLIIKNSY